MKKCSKHTWETIKEACEEDDAPHHVANFILRYFHIELPPIPIVQIVKHLEVGDNFINNFDTHDNINYRWQITKKLGDKIFPHSDKFAIEFAASLLCPLWLLEPLIICNRRSSHELSEIFLISQNLLSFQLKKLA